MWNFPSSLFRSSLLLSTDLCGHKIPECFIDMLATLKGKHFYCKSDLLVFFLDCRLIGIALITTMHPVPSFCHHPHVPTAWP